MLARRWRWPVRIVGALASMVVLIFAIQLTLNRLLALDELIEEWTPVFGFPLKIESTLVRLLPRPLVRLRGLQLQQGLSLEQADIELALIPLLRGDFESGHAELRGGHITLVREASGAVRLGGAESSTPEEDVPDEDEPSARTLPSLPHIYLHDVVINYEDHTVASGPVTSNVWLQHVRISTHPERDTLEATAVGRLRGETDAPTLSVTAHVGTVSETSRRPIRLEIQTDGLDPTPIPQHLPTKWGVRSAEGSLDADVTLAWNDAGFEGRLDLDFAPGKANYAGISFEGRIRFEADMKDHGSFELTNGQITAEHARMQEISVTNLEGRVAYTRRKVDIESFSFHDWDGTLSGTGTLTVGEPLGFDLELKSEDLLLHRLKHPRGGPTDVNPIRMDAEASLQGHWVGGKDWLKPISGRAEVSIHDGEIFSGDMLKSLVQALPRMFEAHHNSSHHGKWHTTPLESLTASFVIEGGRGQTEELRVQTQDYDMKAQGWIDGGGGYEMTGLLTFTPRGITRLLSAASIRGHADTRAGLPPVPFEITGDLSDGRYQVHLEKQPLTALAILPWATFELLEAVSEPLDKD